MRALEREESHMDTSLKCSPEMVCSFQASLCFPELAFFHLCTSDKNHSWYLKKSYGHSHDVSVAKHCHYTGVTEALTVTKNEHIEIVGKGDLGWGFLVGVLGFFFSLLLDWN